MLQHFDGEVRGSSESVETDPLAALDSRNSQGSKADDPGA
jgi:hypothetical protein